MVKIFEKFRFSDDFYIFLINVFFVGLVIFSVNNFRVSKVLVDLNAILELISRYIFNGCLNWKKFVYFTLPN